MKQTMIIVLFLLNTSFSSLAVIIGSNTAPLRQALASFPAIDSDNEMRGFAAFESGFTLEDNTTTCLFNSFFPISGNITFNNGTLNLNLNLALASAAQFINGGTINGNQFSVTLPDKISVFDLGGPMTFNGVELILHSDVISNVVTTFQGECIVQGNGYSIDCSSGDLAVGNGASVLFKDVMLTGISDGAVYCTDSLGTFSFQNVTWIQDSNYSFTQGTIEVLGQLNMMGDAVFAYQSSKQSSIKSNATWFFDSGMTFSYDPSTASSNLIAFTDRTSILHLYETTLFATDVGLQLTKGKLIVEGTCPVISEASVEANGILFGDGASAANNLYLDIREESGLRADSGFSVHKNVS